MKVAEFPDGQGNPPEVVTDTPAPENEACELELLHEPLKSTVAVTVLQVWPRMLAVQVMVPPFSSEVVGVRHKLQEPLALQLAPKVKPLALTVQLLRVGALTAPQIGVPEPEEVLGVVPLVDDVLQVTVATVVVPDFKATLTVFPVHNGAVKLVPPGVTVSANTLWEPSPSTAANVGTARTAITVAIR